ncbi:hypothetical protein Bphy_1192 [Paraburkholderia phymatum STM815]|uniref:Uncharacterized protein n=1 Tax=Paraburkholderia phymatum (strain DSM 17167 / CIP 108236 / LMG 21445 / STM815) TaxID=391038 RepID=B2JHN9_PARP8|nr:hypothetical protein Bphy_1192 [Paraburkholderia phymatum STM815]
MQRADNRDGKRYSVRWRTSHHDTPVCASARSSRKLRHFRRASRLNQSARPLRYTGTFVDEHALPAGLQGRRAPFCIAVRGRYIGTQSAGGARV